MASHRIEVASEIKALEKFCAFPASLVGEERERFMRDYLADIEQFPIEAIRLACAEWRRSGVTKFPTSGQLIPLIRKHLAEEKLAPLREWRPISEEEYEAMSLREKIRHRLILAHEARVTASTHTHGWDRNINTAPPAYRHWIDVAAGHDKEAMRLGTFLRQPAGLAAE